MWLLAEVFTFAGDAEYTGLAKFKLQYCKLRIDVFHLTYDSFRYTENVETLIFPSNPKTKLLARD